jgi:hypothetical protein
MQARSLPARNGLVWLLAGFSLLRRNPPLLISLTMGYWTLFALLMQVVPLIGSILLPLLLPIITVFIANGTRAIATGLPRPLPKGTLVAGIKGNKALVRLCGLNLLAFALIVGLSTPLLGSGLDNPDMLKDDPGQMLILLAELTALSSPLLLAFWFSPLLTGWDGVPAIKSLFFSLVACLRNWRAFTVYALSALALVVVVPGLIIGGVALMAPGAVAGMFAVLRMVFLMLVAPALMAGVYLGYQDIFVHE